jgi:hypothetical protein
MFQLTEAQDAKLRSWLATLPDVPTGAAGGRITYLFTPTGLGVIMEVRDNSTGKSLDLTEYEDW